MGVTLFKIQFDDPSRIYSPGQTITGKVFLIASQSIDISKGIIVKLFGEANARWGEELYNNEKGTYSTIHHGGHETLFESTMILRDKSKEMYGLVESDAYKFSCDIPEKPLPWSSQSKCGTIEYGVEAMIKRPWFKHNFKTKSLFTLRTHVDLDFLHMANEDATVTKRFSFGCMFYSTGSIVISGSLRPMGTLPGKTLPYFVDIDNRSNHALRDLHVELQQVWKYVSRTKRTKRSTKVLFERSANRIIRNGETFSMRGQIQIPMDIIPTQTMCSLITLEYFFKISAKVTGCFQCVMKRVILPVLVGSLPINHSATTVGSNT